MEEGFRAFRALSFWEEYHAIMAKAHLALAAKWREKILRREINSQQEALQTREVYESLWKELLECVAATASKRALVDMDLMKLVWSVPDQHCDVGLLEQLLQTKPDIIDHLGADLRQHREATLMVVKRQGRHLQHASPDLRDDKEVVLAAVRNDSWALEFASDALQGDREVVHAAVANHPRLAHLYRDSVEDDVPEGVLHYASDELRGDREIVLAAVASDPTDIVYASEALRGDKALVLSALKNLRTEDLTFCAAPGILEELSEQLQEDREVVLELVQFDGDVLEVAAAQLRQDKNFLLEAARRAPREDRNACYSLGASQSIRKALCLKDFLGAVESALALPGEENAPVLTVALVATAEPGPSNGKQPAARTFKTCHATLVSGTSFSVNLEPPACEPGRKRRKLLDFRGSSATQQEQPIVVADLAKVLLAELPKHVQVQPLPEHLFLIFSKPGPDGDEAIPVTPWDWSRPVADIC